MDHHEKRAQAERERQRAEITAAEELAAIEAELHARLGSEIAANAVLRAALEETKQLHRETLKENKKLMSLLDAAQAQLLDAHARLAAVRNEPEGKSNILRVATAMPALKKPLQFSEPARDAKRVKIRRGIRVTMDGIPGELVDLSIGGAQTLLTQAVKPNQLVRLTLPTGDGEIVCKGRIVWSVYEQPATSLSVYRNGVKFTDADSVAVEKFMTDFCEKPTMGHRSAEPGGAVRIS